MAGSAEERLDALNREITDLEEKQDAYVSVIAALTEQGLNTAAAKTVLKKDRGSARGASGPHSNFRG